MKILETVIACDKKTTEEKTFSDIFFPKLSYNVQAELFKGVSYYMHYVKHYYQRKKKLSV